MISRSLPSCSPVGRDARLHLPSSGSLGLRFPTFDGTMFCEDCHTARLRSLRLSLASRYLACFRCVCGFPCGLVAGVEATPSRQGLWSPGPPIRGCGKETDGSPTFPSYPFAYMPRSQTPVVSRTLALARPGLLPSGACTPSAFPSGHLRVILPSTTLRISGLNHAACILATPGSEHPFAAMHAGALLTGWLGFGQAGFELYRLSPAGEQQPISWDFSQSQGLGFTLARARLG